MQEKGKVHIKASELEFGSKIAEGKYGTVYKGKCRGQTVAIKLLHNQHLSEEKLEELKTEVEIMTCAPHLLERSPIPLPLSKSFLVGRASTDG